MGVTTEESKGEAGEAAAMAKTEAPKAAKPTAIGTPPPTTLLPETQPARRIVPLNVKEWMKGYVGFGAGDCEAGAAIGLVDGTRFEHGVTIRMADIDEFVAERTHRATLDGYVECDRLGGRIEFSGGTFNMLVDSSNPLVKYMFYRIPFTNAAGARYTMLGHKTLRDDRGLDLWADITTLEIRVFAGDVEGPEVITPAMGPPPKWPAAPIAMGVLRTEFWDGVKSALSFESPGSSRVQKAVAIKKFCGFYGSRLWDLFAKLRPREARANEWTATDAFLSTQKMAPVKWLLAGDLLRRWAQIARASLGNELDIRDWMTHDKPIDLRTGAYGRPLPGAVVVQSDGSDSGPVAEVSPADRATRDAATVASAVASADLAAHDAASASAAAGKLARGAATDVNASVSGKLAASELADERDVVTRNAAGAKLDSASKVDVATLAKGKLDIGPIDHVPASSGKLAAVEPASGKVGLDRVPASSGRHDAVASASGRQAGTTATTDEIWFDYIADTGDDPQVMEALASLIGKEIKPEDLALGEGIAQPTEPLEVGPFVFVGGDTAYHVADETTLRLRFVEPFKRALGVNGEIGQKIEVTHERHLFGIPGNHDYYDNLVGFNRMFRRPYHQQSGGVLHIPGYELRQEASYVKILLPGGWELWGADLANGLDYRQWRYFGTPPDKLILAVPSPPVTFDNVRVDVEDPDDDENKAYRKLFGVPDTAPLVLHPDELAKTMPPGTCRLHIAGDDHHYARYDNGTASPCAVSIVSGGGGAFMHPTETSRGNVKRVKSYPPQAVSATLSTKVINPLVVMSAGLVWFAGGLLATLLYWTFPRSWTFGHLQPAWLWLGALLVSGGSLFLGGRLNKRTRTARKRIAKANRPPGSTAGMPLTDKEREALPWDRRWTRTGVRPVLWTLLLAATIAAPFVARRIDASVDPLSTDAVFLVVMAILTLSVGKLADSRGTNWGFGLLNACACVALPVSIVVGATVVGLALAAASWVVFMAAAPALYRANRRWPLFVLWVIQGAGSVVAIWVTAAYRIGDPVLPRSDWVIPVAFGVGAAVTTAQFGWYLLVSAAFGAHNNEVGAAIRTTEYKQWIRFHVKPDEVIGYVIGVDRPLVAAKPKLVDVFRCAPNR